MAIPDYQSLMRPLLAFAADGAERSVKGATDSLAKELKLSEDEILQLLPSGKQSAFSNKVHWARFYFEKAGAIKRTKRAHIVITERGKKLLAENPKQINVAILRQFPEFVAFLAPKASGQDEPGIQTNDVEVSQTTATPDEAIQQAEAQILYSLRGAILERIAELSPTFFERLVVDLIVAMGYGGSRDSVVQKLSKSADEGIDGVVNEDALGLDAVYLQAKRYTADNTVGRERIQQFAGALVGQGASKGVFVTTSSFSKSAIEYANKVPQKIVLIDGEKLTRLMVQYGVGARIERTVDIKRIDTDYFSEDAE
jgi:restriction system protein